MQYRSAGSMGSTIRKTSRRTKAAGWEMKQISASLSALNGSVS